MNLIREGISEKVTFELRQKGGGVVGPAQSIPGRSKTRNKVATSMVSSRERKKVSLPLGFCSSAILGRSHP